MAKIVTITNPLTGQPAQVDQLDHTAQQIDDGLNIARGVSNPNLLDNWYFGNPVNQRGQTSYTGAGYGIDRWRTTGSGMVVLIENDGITVKNTGTETGYFSQVKEPMEVGYYAASLNVLSVSGAVDAILRNHDTWDYQGTLTISGVGVSRSVLTVKDAWKSYSQWFEIRLAAGASVKLKAAKLELGSQQTLAHQNENGVWQLNEIPDYGEQLARCQRYFYAVNTEENQYACFGTGIAYNGTKAYITVPIPVKMRAFPGITKQGSLALFLNGDYTAIAVSAISAARGSMQGLFEMEVTASGLTPGATYYLAANTDGTARLFFNSEL